MLKRANSRSDVYASGAVDGGREQERKFEQVEGAFATLPRRYRGADEGFSARYRIELEDLGMGWGVELSPDRCEVIPGNGRDADVIIGTDSETWLELREGKLSGTRRLPLAPALGAGAHGPGDRLRGLLPAPQRPAAAAADSQGEGRQGADLDADRRRRSRERRAHPRPRRDEVELLRDRLGLAPRYTVHAIDLPGFGGSSKPGRAPYDPAWFARAIVRFLDAEGIRRAHLVGNSLGGRIAIEVGLAAPDRVNSLSLLTPSMAWRKHRTLVPLVKLLRPELAAIPHTLTSQLVRRQFWSMFGGPDRLHPTVADLAVEEFLAGYRDPAARVAFSAAARNIYLEEPDGPNGFWTRLAGLQPPAMFVWGDHDPLVPMAFSAHVSEVLPNARQIVLNGCGHVPQVEFPEDTNGLLLDFIGSALSPARERAAAHLGRAARRIREVRPRNGGVAASEPAA